MPEIPGYRELSLIGQGTSARVYRAVQASTNQYVAIKVLTTGPRAWDGERSNPRFARELRLCAQLHNPHIVRLMDQGVCGNGDPFAVFEYIPGHSLARHLARQGPISPPQTKELMLQVLDALACAHASGIIHRDLKPENLMITQTGPRLALKVLDFGIGAWSDPALAKDTERLTLAHESLGTPTYCAPEQLKGETPGPQADLYAWGLIFLECLQGTPVMTGLSTAEIIHRQLSDEVIALPPFLAQHWVARLLGGVLIKDPRRREADAAKLYRALANMNLEDLLLPARVVDGPREPRDTQIIPDHGAVQRAERRPLTLLCYKLKIFPLGDAPPPPQETLESLLAEKLAAAQELLGRFGGYPASTLGGGQMAYFGYPYHSDQDTRLAARTSLELRRMGQTWNRELAAWGLRCAIHQVIHSGMAPIIQGKPLISELANTALSVLFSAEKDQILVSLASQRLLRGQARFDAAPNPLRLEGGEEVPLFLLRDEQSSEPVWPEDAELLGRQPPLTALRQWWRDCATSSQAVAVIAEAGVGKSALIQVFAEQIAAMGHPTLIWRCLPEYRHSALHPILTGVAQQLELDRLVDDEARRARLRQALLDAGMEDSNAFEVLCHWLHVSVPNPEQRWHIAPERQRQLLYLALYPLLMAQCREGTLLLVLEDIHWLDVVSLEFLEGLPSQASDGRVMLLLTLRPRAEVEKKLQWVAHRLPLPPLAESESRDLARRLLGERAVDSALLQKLVERSGGIPLFIAELARMEDITRLDGELPLSLMDILCGRIHVVGDAKITLHWAAVAGLDLPVEFLATLMDEDPDWVQARLNRLWEAGLLRLEQESPNLRYGFTHALYRDAAYQQITDPRLRKMHNRVAERLSQSEYPDVALIARHYAKGHRFGEATDYALRAVRDDLGMALAEQALERISELLRWSESLADAERHDVQLQAYELRGQALTHRLGWAHPTVLENVHQIQEFMRQKALLSTHKVKVATLWSLGTFHHVANQRAMVHEVAAQLVDMADHLLDDGLAILGHCLHGVGYWIDGRHGQAVEHLSKVRALYRLERHQSLAREYTLDPYVWATAALGLTRWARGEPVEAHRLAKQAIDHAWEIHHLPSVGIALMYQAFIHQYEQDRDKAAKVATELLSLAETYGLSAVLGYASAVLGWATDDLERITGTLRLLKALGCLLGVTYLQSQAAEVSLRQGDIAMARELLDEGLQMAHDSGENYFLVPLYQQKAYCLLREDATSQGALQCMERAQRLAQSQDLPPAGHFSYLDDYRDNPLLATYWRQTSQAES